MALSGRELTLVLRARDEASRTLGRLSSNMSKMDRDAIRVSQQATRQAEQNLTSMRRGVHAIEETYQRQTIAAREAFYAGKMTSKQYQQAMLTAQKTRVNAISDNRLLRHQQEDFIYAQKEHLRLMAEERDALRHRGSLMIAQGTAAMAAGASMTYFGVRGVEAFASNIQAAMDYETQAARSFTQVDKANASLKQVSDLGKEIADTVPVAFEEIQPAIYDVFSSIDTNLEGARTLMKQFSKDAVGGQTELATATRANLAIMNAYGISVADASKVSDFMFRLVQKGVGTYDEFAKTIGRAIPSAARAGQTYETLGGMLAFMTRNGVSAAMAATSSARALDAISKTKVSERLHEIGIETKNAAGEFRPLPDILRDMNDVFGKMATPERAKALEELFLGAGGTIQARRFFDMYFANAKEFEKRTKEMQDTAGEAEKAFNTMAESPQAKLQELKNNWMLLRIEMGEHLLPTALKIVDGLNKIIDAYQDLDPEVKKAITYIGAFITVLVTTIGILTVIGGAIWVASGAFTALGMSAKSAATKSGAFAAGLILVADGLRRMSSDASETEATIGGFETIVGGALLGSFAGPVGAALGAAAGTLAAITAELKRNKDAAASSIGTWEEYAATLDQVTAATTKQTRAFIFDNLQKSGMIDDYKLIGVGANQLVNSLMGQEKAQHRVNDAMSDTRRYIQEWEEEWEGLPMAGKKIDSYNEHHIGELTKLIETYEKESGAIRESVRRQQERSAVINGLPKEVITYFTEKGVPDTIKKLKSLARQIALTPKQIRTIAKMERIELSEKQVKNLARAGREAKGDLEKMGKAKVKPDFSFIGSAVQALRKGVRQGQREVETFAGEVRDRTRKIKPDLDPFKKGVQTQLGAIKGPAGQEAQGIGTAVKSGVMRGVNGIVAQLSGAVAAAVRAAIRAGKAAAKAKSPSKEMEVLGKDLMLGMVVGIRKNGDKPKDEMSKQMKQILAQINKDIISQLGEEGFHVTIGKFLDIARDQIEKKLDSIAKKLKGAAKKAFAKSRGRKVKSYLEDVADDITKQVKRLEEKNSELRQIRKQLEQRQAELDAIIGARNTFRGGIAEFGSFNSFGLQYVSAGAISAEMTRRVQQVQKFGQDLQTLKGMGFSQAVIDMILAMPISDAMAYAAALVKATPGELANINAGAQVIGGVGGLADQIANSMYQAGIDAAQALVDGLKEKEDDLEAIARKLGKKIAKAIKDELKMKSPSKVALDIARNFGGTLGSGLQESERPLEMASRRLARAMQPSPSGFYTTRPVVGSGYQGGGGSQTVYQQTIPIYTQEIDPRANAQRLGWELANRLGK